MQLSSHPQPYSKGEGHSGYEERVEILQAEVEKKNHMLLEVKKHLREAAEREQQLKTISDDAQVGKDMLDILRATNMWSPVPLVMFLFAQWWSVNLSVCSSLNATWLHYKKEMPCSSKLLR